MPIRAMPLVRIPAPFNHRDWVFELRHDGFRAFAYVEGHTYRLVSRRGHVFTKFSILETEISHSVRTTDAILDAEICCLGADGRSRFYDLLFRRDWPYFVAFDALNIDGEELTDRPLLERERRLRPVMPRIESRLRYLDHVRGGGVDLFARVCEQDCEGVVAKWTHGRNLTDGVRTSWIKVKNPAYSQIAGRREVFESRSDHRRRTRVAADAVRRPCARLRRPCCSARCSTSRRSTPLTITPANASRSPAGSCGRSRRTDTCSVASFATMRASRSLRRPAIPRRRLLLAQQCEDATGAEFFAASLRRDYLRDVWTDRKS